MHPNTNVQLAAGPSYNGPPLDQGYEQGGGEHGDGDPYSAHRPPATQQLSSENMMTLLLCASLPAVSKKESEEPTSRV